MLILPIYHYSVTTKLNMLLERPNDANVFSIQKGFLKDTAKVKKTKRPDAKVKKFFSIQKGFLKISAKVEKTKRPCEVKKTKKPNAKAVKK